MASNKNYKCYGCNNIVPYDTLAYECMCWNKDPEAAYRGVCHHCDNNDVRIHIGFGHSLRKVHIYSPEWQLILDFMEKTKSGFSYIDNGIIKVMYYKGPNGEIGKDFEDWFAKDTGDNDWIYSEDLREKVKKYKAYETFTVPAKYCVCCHKK